MFTQNCLKGDFPKPPTQKNPRIYIYIYIIYVYISIYVYIIPPKQRRKSTPEEDLHPASPRENSPPNGFTTSNSFTAVERWGFTTPSDSGKSGGLGCRWLGGLVGWRWWVGWVVGGLVGGLKVVGWLGGGLVEESIRSCRYRYHFCCLQQPIG